MNYDPLPRPRTLPLDLPVQLGAVHDASHERPWPLVNLL
nr:MAG TPA: hypothetical protein [Caudoviricetes sp.]